MARQKVNASQIKNYAFNAILNANQTFTTAGTDYKLNLATELYDYNSVFDNSLYRFIAPFDGVWHFDFALHLAQNANTTIEIRIYKNSVVYAYGVRSDGAGGFPTIHQGMDIPVAAGDYIEMFGQGNAASAIVQGSTPVATYMSGFLINKNT